MKSLVGIIICIVVVLAFAWVTKDDSNGHGGGFIY